MWATRGSRAALERGLGSTLRPNTRQSRASPRGALPAYVQGLITPWCWPCTPGCFDLFREHFGSLSWEDTLVDGLDGSSRETGRRRLGLRLQDGPSPPVVRAFCGALRGLHRATLGLSVNLHVAARRQSRGTRPGASIPGPHSVPVPDGLGCGGDATWAICSVCCTGTCWPCPGLCPRFWPVTLDSVLVSHGMGTEGLWDVSVCCPWTPWPCPPSSRCSLVPGTAGELPVDRAGLGPWATGSSWV